VTLIPEIDEGVPNPPLQRVTAESGAERIDVLVHSHYFRVIFPRPVRRPFKGRAVVDCYEPLEWRHPPEPDCVREWEQAGE
jgi:hypothetical protein